jgi:flagellar hook-associated protein 3 FlgL
MNVLRALDAATETYLYDLSRVHQRLQRAQREIASGKRVNSVSDSPNEISSLLQSRTALETTRQIRSDLGRFQTEVNTAESALESAERLLERALVLGAQGAGTTATAEQRQMLGQQVGAILEQLVSLANTRVEGRNIFSGDSDQTAAYTLDFSLTPPLSTYQGSAATRRAMDPTGTQFPVSLTAQQIFDSANPSENVFQSLLNLRTGLLNNDPVAIDAAIGQMKTAADYLRTQHAFYGGVQRRVLDAIDTAATLETRLQQQISTIEDADIVASALELSDAKNQQEAALQVKAANPPRSLFDYLG